MQDAPRSCRCCAMLHNSATSASSVTYGAIEAHYHPTEQSFMSQKLVAVT